jgi:fructoselysine transporter
VAGSCAFDFCGEFVRGAYIWNALGDAGDRADFGAGIRVGVFGDTGVPYAAALDGNFFSVFARVHPTKRFPHVALLALGATSIAICLFYKLDFVIRAILAMRCLIQFVGQAVGLMILHRRWKAGHWPFRMWLYPVPVVLAIAGWVAIFISTGRTPMLDSLVVMAAGILVYMGRARMLRQWPFEEART